MDRVIDVGAHGAFLGLRPWTRLECARLLIGLREQLQDNKDDDLRQAVEVLAHEFASEMADLSGAQTRGASLDSIYVRSLAIGGTPLRDGYHFGQTLVNDYGRPYWTGHNAIIGFEASGSARHGVMYVRSEYQSGSAGPAYSSDLRRLLSKIDQVPSVSVGSSRSTGRFRIIEAYFGLNWSKVQLTVGKQSPYWGPAESGALLFSSNPEPIYMARLTQTQPIRLPGILRHLGLLRWDSFLGKLSGHDFPRAPILHGQKVSFKPTENLEVGFSRTVMFAGEGRGFTFARFWRSFVSVGDNLSTIPGTSRDVGDRRGGFDIVYRLPKLRNRVTVYSDFMTDDDPSPLAAPQRSIIVPGVHVKALPFARNWEVRVEAAVSARPAVSRHAGNFFYHNGAYPEGYTNRDYILGHWVGRDSKAVWMSSRYWISPNKVLDASFRSAKISRSFIPGGGSQKDCAVGITWPIGPMELKASAQHERYVIPVLAMSSRRNVLGMLQLRYRLPDKYALRGSDPAGLPDRPR